MTIYVHRTYHPMQNGNRWSYGMGKLVRRLTGNASFSSLSAYQRKKILEEAVAMAELQGYFQAEAGEKAAEKGPDGRSAYDIRGRYRDGMGKYTVCEKDSGKPVWYLVVED